MPLVRVEEIGYVKHWSL